MIPNEGPEFFPVETDKAVAVGAGTAPREAYGPGGPAGQGHPFAGGRDRGAMERGDLEACPRAGGQRRRPAGRAGERENAWNRAFPRREDEPARGDEVVGLAAPQVRDDGGERPTFQRLLHGPERVGAGHGAHHHKPCGVEPMRREARSVGGAPLPPRAVLDDPDHGRARAAGEAGGQRQRETAGGAGIAGARRHHLMYGATPEAAAQHMVERDPPPQRDLAGAAPVAEPWRKAAIAGDPGDGVAQKTDLFRPAAWRHRLTPRCDCRANCSVFVLIDSGGYAT